MNYLLDTQIYLWSVAGSPRLSRSAKALIVNAERVFVSAASIWEAAIKKAIGKLSGDPDELAASIEPSGFVELAVTAAHAARVARLPRIHDDPFDRLLVAQAMHEPLRLITADRLLARYSELVHVA
jgi:PIN domain nuclease of toxin-antitoxin system